jgi:hypothetical protein
MSEADDNQVERVKRKRRWHGAKYGLALSALKIHFANLGVIFNHKPIS